MHLLSHGIIDLPVGSTSRAGQQNAGQLRVVQIIDRAVSYCYQAILQIIGLCIEPRRATIPAPRNFRQSHPIGSAPASAVAPIHQSPMSGGTAPRVQLGDVLTETATFSTSTTGHRLREMS
jgi:hypothetical protein